MPGNAIGRLKWVRLALDAIVRWLVAAADTAPRPGRRAFTLATASALTLGVAGCASFGLGAAPAPPPPPPSPPVSPPPPPPPPAMDSASPTYDDGVTWEQRPQRLPAFPWPPPEPSAQIEVRRSRFADDSTFGEVALRLDRALRQCGHLRESYYEAPGGFAIVTRLERLREDARPEVEDRFVTPGSEGTQGFLGFIQSLWFAPTGYYRQIVFIITDKPFVASEAPPTVQMADRMLAGGLGYLPQFYADRSFSARHRVEALIYEFQKEGEARAEVARPARWNAHTHLLRLGLLHAL